MILHGVNSEDYLYLRLLSESNAYPFEYSDLREGTILRFQIEKLRKDLWKSSVFQHLDCFHFEEKKHRINAYLPSSLYSKVTVIKDINLQINMDSRDILLINEWLWDRLNSLERPTMTPANQLSFLLGTESSKSPVERNWYHLNHTRLFRYDGKEVVGSSIFETDAERIELPESTLLSLPTCSEIPEEKSKLIDCYQFGNDSVIIVPLRRGDVIDFHSSVMTLLFLRQDYLRMLLSVEELTVKEHLECFERDFEGYLKDANRRYFKLQDYLKISSLNDLFDSKVFEEIRKRSSTFQNPFSYYGNDYRVSKVCFDDEGYIRYICCNDEPIVEHELSKIANRVSYEEAEMLYQKEQEAKLKEEENRYLQRKAKEYFQKNKARYYKLEKRYPGLTYMDFMFRENCERKKQKIDSIKRLVLVLNHRIDSLNK